VGSSPIDSTNKVLSFKNLWKEGRTVVLGAWCAEEHVMREATERYFLDQVAIARQVKIIKSHATPEAIRQDEDLREPHRLAKQHAADETRAGPAAGNPRKNSTKTKLSLTVHERSSIEQMQVDLKNL
jgi:hypothetical protein